MDLILTSLVVCVVIILAMGFLWKRLGRQDPMPTPSLPRASQQVSWDNIARIETTDSKVLPELIVTMKDGSVYRGYLGSWHTLDGYSVYNFSAREGLRAIYKRWEWGERPQHLQPEEEASDA